MLWGLHKGVLGHVHSVMGDERCSALVWYPCSDCVLPWEFVLARWKCVQGWGEECFLLSRSRKNTSHPMLFM